MWKAKLSVVIVIISAVGFLWCAWDLGVLLFARPHVSRHTCHVSDGGAK